MRRVLIHEMTHQYIREVQKIFGEHHGRNFQVKLQSTGYGNNRLTIGQNVQFFHSGQEMWVSASVKKINGYRVHIETKWGVWQVCATSVFTGEEKVRETNEFYPENPKKEWEPKPKVVQTPKPKPQVKKPVVVATPIVKATSSKPNGYEVRENGDKDGIEIEFTGKPKRAVLQVLKDNGFRWKYIRNVDPSRIGYWWIRAAKLTTSLESIKLQLNGIMA